MKKIYFFTLFYCYLGFSQVGVQTITPQSTFDVVATNPTGTTTNVDGVLIPRVTRQRAQSMAAVPTSTMVFITEAVTGTLTGTTINVATSGFYFFDGTVWQKVATGASTDWSLTGNSGTSVATNFVGTIDATDLALRTTNVDRLRISAAGNVGINIVPSTYKLDVSGGATTDAIFGHSNNVGGILGRETNISFGTPAQNILGAGVYANNPSAGYTSMFSQSIGAATVAASINYSSVWIANYNFVDNASATVNPSASYSQLNATSTTLVGKQIALRGFNNRGTTAGNPGYSVGAQGLANVQNQDSYGVEGLSFSNAPLSTGGYFEGNNYAGSNIAYAYVGGWTNGLTARKITGTGTVNEIVPTLNHGRVTLTCPESPEYWYQDYGTVQMANGKATINLDPILADIIVVDNENPIRVICTPVGMPYFNGVTIMNQTEKSVEILELNGGLHSGKLQYQIVVKPKTNFGEGRFSQAPGPGYLKADKEPMAAKAKNQPNDGRKIFKWPSDSEVYKYNPEDYISVGDVVPSGPNAGKIKLGNGKYSNGLPAEMPKK